MCTTHIANNSCCFADKFSVGVLALLPPEVPTVAGSRSDIRFVVCGFPPLGLGRHHLPPQLGRTFPEGLADLLVRSLFSNVHPHKAAVFVALPLDKPNAPGSEFIQELHGNLGFFASCRTQICHLVFLDGFLESQISGMDTRGSSPSTHHVLRFQSDICSRGRRQLRL